MSYKYISDLHLGHANILKNTKRGERYESIDEMDSYIIRQWNEFVDISDDVWILGDFSYRSSINVGTYLEKLKGHKHLILGNHDAKWRKNVKLENYFESVSHMEVIRDGKKLITLCHFPLFEWSQSRYAKHSPDGVSWLIHGHIHDSKNCDAYQFIKTKLPCALNAGFDINDHPVSFEELLVNNDKWYER